MPLVAGVDSSTQSTKVVLCDADSGAVVDEARARHPDATEVDPEVWWDALRSASGLLDRAAAVAVAGQQHGMVVLDGDRRVVRPALLWNDTRSAPAALRLIEDLGGPKAWAEAVGSVPVASFTVTKLRWLADHEPEAAAAVRDVVLPHDFITARLQGDGAPLVTDRGDASGTGYWSPAAGAYREDLLELALGRVVGLPAVAAPGAQVGRTPGGAVVAPGTGDNMAAALGLGAGPGDAIVSLGTSGTAFAVTDDPVADPTGTVAGFADATGRFLPLVATLNAARVLTAAADLLGVPLAELDRLALRAEPGAGGVVLLPYLDGERTPNLPDASGTLLGLRRANMTPANLARAAVEGMLCGLADGLAAVRAQGVEVRRVLLIGGAAAASSVRALAAELLGAPVVVPAPGEYVALGAARQAAWALSGRAAAPDWRVADSGPAGFDPAGSDPAGSGAAGSGDAVRDQYAAARRFVYSQEED